jgi:serine protease Do
MFTVITLTRGQDLSQLFKQLDPTVVTIEVTEYKIQNQQVTSSEGLGSGVVISKDGLILTAAHIVNFANKIEVKMLNGSTIQADVISVSGFADVALLKLRTIPTDLKFAKLGNSELAEIGEQILVIGSPLGFEHSLSVGHISRKIKKNVLSNGEMVGFIQTDAAINKGNSGGPMFNLNGEVIGVVSFILSQSGGFEGLGFGIDINTVKKTMFDVNKFWTGFEGIFLNETLASIFNTPQQSGVLIQRVTPNSFADQIGLIPGFVQAEIFGQKLWLGGDIVLSIQGVSCNSPHNLKNIKSQIDSLKENDTILIEVLRKGKLIMLESNYLIKKAN